MKNENYYLRHAICLIFLLMFPFIIYAQAVVKGTVTDGSDRSPLPGVSIAIAGTTEGTITDTDGNYSIKVAKGQTLIFSMMGYITQKHPVTSLTLNVSLQQDNKQLDEIIVTALGIKRESKALGYSAQELKGNEIVKVKQPNLINSLNGKIAGVNITNSGGGAGASSQIIIRGGTSLLNDNQPLFIVDGLPIDNSTAVGNTSIDGAGATATTSGNRAMDINPDDIESISVLKGATAAALYGLKAANGAIIITTKRGKEGKASVKVSAKMSIDNINRLPDIQDLYGQGTKGEYNNATNLSWGYLASDSLRYNNMNNFFQTALSYDLNASVSGGSKTGSYYMSAQRLDQDGVVPTTDYVKNSFRLNAEQKVWFLTFGMNANYINSTSRKALTGGGLWGKGGSGYMLSILNWPITDNMSNWLNSNGTRRRLMPDVPLDDDIDNPYWIVNKSPMTEKLDRFIGSVYINAQPLSWLDFAFKMGLDHFNSQTKNITAAGSSVILSWQNGAQSLSDRQSDLFTTNFLMNINKTYKDFNFGLMLGHGYEQNSYYNNTLLAVGMLNPDFEGINNTAKENKTYDNYRQLRRLISVFGEARIGYKSIAYLSVTGRNDWSSTLPKDSRSFFYPSFSGSFVFSELIKSNPYFSFGKLRGSWAQVGKDAPPYKTLTNLDPPLASIGGGYRDSWSGGNPQLKPEKTRSWEIGADLRFFKGRLGFDITYYNNLSENQIINPRVSNAIGYIFKFVNAGEISNKGMEITINGTPVESRDWGWESQLNLSYNKGRVKNLIEGMKILYVTDVQIGPAKAASFNDGNFLGLSGTKWQTNDEGQLLIDKNGYPLTSTDETQYLGNREPDFLLGFSNTLRYKDLSLSFLFDARFGGTIYNATEWAMVTSGQAKVTENRGEKKVFEGVVKQDDGSYIPNTKEVILDEYYYRNIYTKHAPHFLTDVNWLRLRSLALTYSIPQSFLQKLKVVQQAELSFTANNVFVITNYKGMDPEVSAGGAGVVGAGSAGIDYCGIPSTRTFSFGINVTF
ncbi:MAG: SusC/RagA family TonB-linked outer membrane protein [Bacteroidales bacterium]